MEMTATNLSRRKTHPILLVRSSEGVPRWVSSLESHKLAVGESNFTCCERNHEGVFEKCDRGVAKEVLDRMILKKMKYLFTMNNVNLARLTLSQWSWYLRGLPGEILQSNESEVRKALKWDLKYDGPWFDRDGVSILIYSILSNQVRVVSSLLKSLDKVDCEEERKRRLVSAVPRKGFVEAGITGKMNALSFAMYMSTPEIVEMLLDQGFDPMLADSAGNHPFLFACTSNRIDNVKYWLKRFPEWDLELQTQFNGGVALGAAVYLGPNRLELVRLLLKAGAKLTALNYLGGSILTAATSNEDSDPNVVRLLLKLWDNVNLKYRPRTIKWKLIHHVAKISFRVLNTSNGLLRSLAMDSGATALHFAATRGDMEIVELLLSEGADPSLKNDLGQDAAAMCTSFPELRGVLEKRERKTKLRGGTKKTKKVEVLGKRISTATLIQHEMWLISLETLLMLYVYLCLVDFSLTLIYLTHHTHTGTEKVARVVSWKFIRS